MKLAVTDNVAFEVQEYISGPKGTIYVLNFDDVEDNELDLFISDDEVRSHAEFGEVMSKFLAIPEDGLTRGYYFKAESYELHGWVKPFKKHGFGAELRLYCIKPPNANLIIAGGGCIKDGGGALKNYPRCRSAFNLVCNADERIGKRLRTSDLDIQGHRLVGNRHFGPFD